MGGFAEKAWTPGENVEIVCIGHNFAAPDFQDPS